MSEEEQPKSKPKSKPKLKSQPQHQQPGPEPEPVKRAGEPLTDRTPVGDDGHGDGNGNGSGNGNGDADGGAGDEAGAATAAAEHDRLAEPVDAELPPRLPFPVVGIGGSAGGIEAFMEFFSAMPADAGIAYVVIQHLPPDRDSLMVDILSNKTTMPVVTQYAMFFPFMPP